MPYRVLCECGWTSAAGPETSVLLELKGHLEDSLDNGAQLLRTQVRPSAESPNPGQVAG